MRKKHLMLAAALLLLPLLSSCALIPEEESVRTAPLMRTYESEIFELAPVERSDLQLTESVSCRYVPVKSASLTFDIGGEYIDRMNVQLGDFVKAGQLLGQLQTENLEQRILDAQSNVARLELQAEHLQSLYALALRRNEIASADLDPQARLDALEALEADYDARRTSLEDTLTLARLEVASLEDELNSRQILAPFDGTITYVKKFKEGDMYSFGETAITLADSTMSLFRAETNLWHLFSPGDTYDITVGKKVYPAVVSDEASLGLPPSEKVEGEKAYVYFALREPSFDLEENDRGIIQLVLEEYPDVLHVPKQAVSTAGEQAIVYYKREDGMKAYKPVEAGVTIGSRTIILSGLSEGDSIIVN